MYKLDKEKHAKKIEELKAQCPDNELLELSFNVGKKSIVVYGKPPSRAVYKQFKAKAKNNHQEALEVLVSESVIHPEPAEFQKLLDRYPGLLDNIGGYLFESIGQTQDAEVSNL
jgi:hypothetical protein